MRRVYNVAAVALISMCCFYIARAQTADCSSFTFSNGRILSNCQSLPRLGSSIHWNYSADAGTISIAYRAPQTADGWVAWGLNLNGQGMIGTQAIVGLQASTGNGSMNVFTTPISDRSPTMKQTPLSFPVANLAGDFSNDVMTLFATITLPNNTTVFNHAWQASNMVSGGVPVAHPTTGDNILSFGSLDFLSGQASSAGGSSVITRRNIHGVLNAVSWGVMMPIGVMIARYVKVFESADPAWFYLHVSCQFSGYIIGVSGWALGLKLGSESEGITYHHHRSIGIVLFCFATLQALAIFLRPQKNSKYRVYWNIYHHTIGYSVIILSIANIFQGFHILKPANKWRNAYIAVIAVLGGIALVMEILTWVIVLRRKKTIVVDKTRIRNINNGQHVV